MDTLITYKIVKDQDDKLKNTAKLACNFWNRFIIPESSIIIRLGTFQSLGSTIARAYEPYKNDGIVYGVVEFNTNFLSKFNDYEISGTIIHEIGHSLGFGWDRWMELFDKNTGKFKQEYIDQISELESMYVETGYGSGTQFSHWDEEKFDRELMTGFKDTAEYVLPVTIKVNSLLGHTIAEELTESQKLEDILKEIEKIRFTRMDDVKKIDLEYYEETKIWEEIFTKS